METVNEWWPFVGPILLVGLLVVLVREIDMLFSEM
jgi:hypothetical protein